MENSGTIGNFGSYKLEVSHNGYASAVATGKFPQEGNPVVETNNSLKIDIIEALRLAAKETSNGVDDIMVAMIAKAFGR